MRNGIHCQQIDIAALDGSVNGQRIASVDRNATSTQQSAGGDVDIVASRQHELSRARRNGDIDTIDGQDGGGKDPRGTVAQCR